MSTIGGLNTVRNGLVLHLDPANIKSFRGEPTTNLYGDINTTTVLRYPLYEYNTNAWTNGFPIPPENVGRVYKHTSGALSSTWSNNSYGYTLKNYTYTGGLYYTLSCWVYVSGDCNIDTLGCSMEGTALTDNSKGWYDMTKKGTWQRLQITCYNIGNIAGNMILVYPAKFGVTDGSFTGFYAWGGGQLETKSYITPYVLGTRGTTVATGGGLIDLSGYNNSGELINGVVYNGSNKGSLVFDGINDRITHTSITFTSTDAWTWNGIFNPISGILTGLHTSSANDTGILLSSNYITFRNSIGTFFSSGVAVVTNAISCVSLVAIGDGTLKIYTNGIYRETQTGSGGTSIIFGIIGYLVSNAWFFNGRFYNIQIYRKALSSSEILQNYNATKSRFGL